MAEIGRNQCFLQPQPEPHPVELEPDEALESEDEELSLLEAAFSPAAEEPFELLEFPEALDPPEELDPEE